MASTSTPKKATPIAAPVSKEVPATLTVIVTNTKNERAAGARVSLEPSGATGATDSQGEIQFKLGTATKYNVTVTLEKNTITVPYYVTEGGAARLMVNPTYVKAVEAAVAKANRGPSLFSPTGFITGGIIVLIVVFVLAFRRLRRR